MPPQDAELVFLQMRAGDLDNRAPILVRFGSKLPCRCGPQQPAEDEHFWLQFLRGLVARGPTAVSRKSPRSLPRDSRGFATSSSRPPRTSWPIWPFPRCTSGDYSTTPLERLHKELKRRTDVVGIFPTPKAAIRLTGALLAEQNDEWETARRYFSLESMKRLRSEPSPSPELPLSIEHGGTPMLVPL
jgi:hypothetical protein